MYCTCGHCLIDSEPSRKFNKRRLDALSFPHYVIKKGCSHGARHGKTEEQKKYHIAWNAWKRCCKKVDSQCEHFTGIHDRFLRDPMYREPQLAIGWTEQKCKELDELAKEDHTCRLTPEEKKRYQGKWYITLNKSGKNGPMILRSDFRAAVSMKNRLHRERGEKVEEPISPEQDRKWHPSSSTSWWNKNWKWAHKIFSIDLLFVTIGFVYSRWWSTVTDGWCRQEHLTSNFSHAPLHMCKLTARLKTSQGSRCLSARFIPSTCHPWCSAFERSLVVPCFSLSCFSPSSTSSLPHSTCSLPGTPSFMSSPPRVKTTALTQNEEYCSMEKNHPLTSYEPKLLDDFDDSETSAMIFQDESGDIDTEPSYSCDAELDDEIIGKALSSPLFTQEREERANRRQAYHSHEEILLPAHSFSVCHSRMVKPVHELNSLSSCNSEKPSREMENETIRILVERQKEQLLVDFRVEIQKHEFQADHDRRSIHELRVSAKRNWHFCIFEIICELL